MAAGSLPSTATPPAAGTARPSAYTHLRVGVLAVQGAYAAHQAMLESMGAATCCVRSGADLAGLDALVIPGGESSTLLHFLQQGDFWQALQSFIATHPCLGTCAGLILLAEHVSPEQACLGALPVSVQRNAYGRQRDSHIAFNASKLGSEPLEMVFIRAPKITAVGTQVDVLATHRGDPVLVQHGHLIGCAFHPELGQDTRVHQRLLDACLSA